MFSKLSSKLDSKLDRFLPASSAQQVALSPSGQREQLDAGSKKQLFRHRFWRGVNLGQQHRVLLA
jgi:hypothetical protein